jgi:RimJ/RimL family protein N-acetyltransferase
MSSIAFRPATHADVDAIVAMQIAPHARDFVLAATPDEVRAALENPERATFVITTDGEPAGMLLLVHEPRFPWLVEFRRIVVMQPGRGIGTAAVEFVIDWAFRERHAHRIHLDVVAANGRARRLYERAGFVHEGTLRDGFSAGDGSYGELCQYGLLATDPRM